MHRCPECGEECNCKWGVGQCEHDCIDFGGEDFADDDFAVYGEEDYED